MQRRRSAFGQDLTLIALLYAVSYAVMLWNNGRFFDDWMFYDVDLPSTLKYFSQARLEWAVYYIHGVLSLQHVFLFRAITFFSYWAATVCLYRILENVREMEPYDRFFVVALFSVFPVNFGRVAFAASHYALCHAAFFFAFFLLTVYLKDRKFWLRPVILVLFYWSFLTNSLLVFYAAPLLYILYVHKALGKSPAEMGALLLRYADFVILPLVFWFIKRAYFNPYGSFEQWNRLSPKNFLNSPGQVLVCFQTSFLKPLDDSMGYAVSHIAYFLVPAYLIFLWLKGVASRERQISPDAVSVFLPLGVLLFVLGVFPYIAAGQLPEAREWQSRHQMLVPLGAAMILYYTLKAVLDRFKTDQALRTFLFAFILSAFMASNIRALLEYQVDWYKQMALVEQFRSSDVIRNNTNFLFVDHTKNVSANGRTLGFFEYNGLFKYAFKDTTRFGADLSALENNEKDYLFYKDYPGTSMSQYRLTKPQYTVTIEPGSFLSAGWRLLPSLWYRQIFRADEYHDRLKNMLVLHYDKRL